MLFGAVADVRHRAGLAEHIHDVVHLILEGGQHACADVVSATGLLRSEQRLLYHLAEVLHVDEVHALGGIAPNFQWLASPRLVDHQTIGAYGGFSIVVEGLAVVHEAVDVR